MSIAFGVAAFVMAGICVGWANSRTDDEKTATEGLGPFLFVTALFTAASVAMRFLGA